MCTRTYFIYILPNRLNIKFNINPYDSLMKINQKFQNLVEDKKRQIPGQKTTNLMTATWTHLLLVLQHRDKFHMYNRDYHTSHVC